jgi:phage terminase large subunit GpA-like protein
MSLYAQAFAEGLKPDPTLTVSEWSDRYRILPSKGAAEPGRFRTSRTPYLREIMDCLSPVSPVQRIVFMKSSQVGGTEMGLNWLGSIIHLYPAPMMIVQPDLVLAERFSKQRVAPMIEETPELAELVKPARSRESGNTLLLKEFRGGLVVFSGSNSGASLRSMPVRYLFCDEVSAYAPDADGEGDPVSLAEKRTQTFGVRAKVFLNSTPKTKGTCRIEFEYEKTDQRRFFVPCPHCGEFQWLKWKQVKWDEGRPETVHYVCEFNSCVIEEYHKSKMLGAGEWRATNHSSSELTRGYHISALYSPLGWKSWAAIVMEFLDAVEKQRAGSPDLLKTWVNSILGETWEEEYAAKVGAEGLRARAETYDTAVVPEGVLVLVAGVDVQDNRLSASIYGFGRGEESWLVDRQVLYGDPAQAAVWKQLDDVLFAKRRHALGYEMSLYAAAIDTGGHYTHETYAYARERRGKSVKVLAVKGQSQKGKPAIGQPKKVDINFKGQKLKWGVELYPVGADTIKSTLYARLKLSEPGEGFVHFPASVPNEFFEELTSEKKVTRFVKGFPVTEWVKPPGRRNEALDEAVYARAALEFVFTRHHRKTVWDQLERRLHAPGVTIEPAPKSDPATPPGPELEAQPVADGPSQEQAEPEKTSPPDESALKKRPAAHTMPRRRGGGFVSRW